MTDTLPIVERLRGLGWKEPVAVADAIEALVEALNSVLPHPDLADQTLMAYGDFALERVASHSTVCAARAALDKVRAMR